MGYDSYERGDVVGEGTFGRVYRATERATGRTVAIKKLLNSRSAKEGTDLSTLREIMLLQELKHEHVIDMLEVRVGHAATAATVPGQSAARVRTGVHLQWEPPPRLRVLHHGP